MSLRILLLNSEYPPIGGGASNASAQIARELVALGQEVTVVTARYGDLPHTEEQDGVNIVRVPAPRRYLERSSWREQLAFIVSGALFSIPVMRSFRPDVVLAFFGAPCGISAWLLKGLFGVPYIVSLRGGDVPGFRPYDFALYHKLLSPLLHIVWRRAAAVVANSQGLCQMANDFDARVPVQIIPNGVNMQRFSANHRVWEPAHLLIVGRIVYQKGIDLLLRALSEMQDLPWKLSVVGNGPDLDALRALAASLSLGERVNFTGWKSREEIAEYYAQANLFAYPSRHEGMPNVVLEAMASGLPVVASRIAGNEELVLEGQNGLLVPAEDPESLQTALRQMIGDVEQRQQMGAASRAIVAGEYTWEKVAQQYLELMQQVVEAS